MLSVDGLTMIYGDRVLFHDVSFHFSFRRRYGLVGANGAGKTTFLKIVSGSQTPSSGSVQVPKDMRIGTLDQDYFRFKDEKILDVVMMGDQDLWETLKRKDILLAKEELTTDEIKEVSEIEVKLMMKEGYRSEAKASELLNGLGIEQKRHEMPLSSLSAGYKLRVFLAQVLFIKPEILLLDEPTNYLDLFSIRWLERYLMDYPGTVILSSHDRTFLNKVCQEILDIDYGTMKRYVGNFDHFIEQKEKEVAAKESELEALSKRKKDIQRFITRFKAKASKARQASSREKMIEKLEKEEKESQIFPSSRQYPHFHFHVTRPSGQRAMIAKDISKSFGDRSILSGVSFEIERLEKIAIVGPNGVGKSTLIEILTENLQPDSGRSRWGPHVQLGYFPQDFYKTLSEEMTLYDWISGATLEVSEQKIRQTLGQMLFDDQAIRKKIGALSVGERARLIFAELMMKDHNILILDEPTNHLDMESVDALIQAIKEYKGTVVTVSHNRYFISEIANRIIELKPGGLLDFRGGYEEFVEEHERDYLDKSSPKISKSDKSYEEKKEKRKERNRIKRSIEKLEKEIAKSEKSLDELNEVLAAPNFYQNTPPTQQKEILDQKAKLEKIHENDLNSWEDLMDSLNLIDSN